MSVMISDETLRATQLSEGAFKEEIAVFFFRQHKLTLEGASKLAEMGQAQFQHLLASRRIPVHYDADDLEHDLKTLRALNMP